MPLQSKREYGSVVLLCPILCYMGFFCVLLFLNFLYLVLRWVLIMIFLNFVVVS